MSELKTLDYIMGFNEAATLMRPARILTLDEANELLERCEQSHKGKPNNTISDILVPSEILHELLLVWKAAR